MRNDGEMPPNTFSILHLDPPLHATYRKIVNRQFTPRAVAGLEDSIRAMVTEAFDQVDPSEVIDGVDVLTARVPIAIIAEMFGIGGADRETFRIWSDAIIASPDDADALGSAEEVGRMAEYLMAHIESPATDGNALLDILKSTDLDGRPLDVAEIMGFCLTLLVAGNETTRTLISGGMEALHDHPDQRATLAVYPSLMPGAIEELLRWVTPIQAFGRTAVTDVTLGDETIDAGDFVVLLYASGIATNRHSARPPGSSTSRVRSTRRMSPSGSANTSVWAQHSPASRAGSSSRSCSPGIPTTASTRPLSGLDRPSSAASTECPWCSCREPGESIVKFALSLGQLNPTAWVDVAVAADELGFDSVWIPEHLVLPVGLGGSPHQGSDHPPIPPDVPVFDALQYLAFVAAKTRRIRLGTHVYNIGLRHPFVVVRRPPHSMSFWGALRLRDRCELVAGRVGCGGPLIHDAGPSCCRRDDRGVPPSLDRAGGRTSRSVLRLRRGDVRTEAGHTRRPTADHRR